MSEELDFLNARAREWSERLLELADKLEALALEWKLPRETVDEMRADHGVPAETPRLEFFLPIANNVMGHVAGLRQLAASAHEGPFWPADE